MRTQRPPGPGRHPPEKGEPAAKPGDLSTSSVPGGSAQSGVVHEGPPSEPAVTSSDRPTSSGPQAKGWSGSGGQRIERDDRVSAAESLERSTPPEAVEALRHDLHVHQVELEMQNEELRRTRDELEVSRESYFDLYDLAPVGYVTLDREGVVAQANLTVANQLGVTRGHLVGQPLGRFVAQSSGAAYVLYLRRLFQTGEGASTEVGMVTASGAEVCMRLDAAFRDRGGGVARPCLVTLTDVTGRDQAEKLLAKAEERLRLALEAADLGSFDLDMTTGRSVRSLRYDRMFGHAEGLPEWTLEAALGGVLPEDLPLVLEAHARAERTGVLDYEARVGWADGSTHWIAPRGIVHYDSRGHPARLVGVVADITERKRAEQALRDSEEKFSALFHSSPVAMAMTSTVDGTFTDINRAFLESSGFSREEVLGRTSVDLGLFVNPTDRDSLVGAALGHGGVYGRPLTLRAKSGSVRDCLVSMRMVHVGDRTHLLSSILDVTERRRAEEALREEQEQFRTFFDLSPVGKLLMDPDCRLLRVNRAFCRMLGYSSEALESKTFVEITHPEDLTRSLAMTGSLLAGTEDEGEVEKRFLSRDGRAVWTQVKARLLREPSGSPLHFLVNIIDISDRKAAEKALGDSYDLLEGRVVSRTAELSAANREMEAFTYSVSHDLRSPLRAIDGFGARLDRECAASLGDEGRRLLGVIRANARQMATLIDDLLALSRVGRTEMKLERVDMARMALEVGAEIGKDNGWGCDFRVGSLPEAWGSRGLLRQVWQNLLSNAFKFSSKTPHPDVRVDGSDVDGVVSYRVRDNGAGFDMAYRDKLFGVFQRLHPTTDFAGVGIGLALVHRIVTRHGGHVAAEGAVGQGATFTFSLPAPGVIPGGPTS